MKKILLTGIILGMMFQMSCKKAVEVEPTSILTSAAFWKTESDAAGALNGMYVKLRNEAAINLFLLGEARSQTMSQALAGAVGVDRYYLNTLNTSNAGPSWAGLYSTIDMANLILKYVPNIKMDETVKNNILAQAYTTRAYVYYVMVRAWGGVPIRTTPTEIYDPAGIQVARSSASDVFTLIKSDLNTALTLYPNNNFIAGRNTWNKVGANVLKADVYLWTAKRTGGSTPDLNIALSAINDAQTADVGLLPVYSDVFSYTNKGNREVIMSLRFQILESTNNYFEYMYLNATNNPNNITTEVKDFIGAIGSGNAGNSIMQVAQPVRDQFTIDDQRRVGTFYEIKSSTGSFITSITTKGRGVVEAGVRHFKNDVILYRYADVLLMKAEIMNALGLDPVNEINEVRKRAYGNAYSNHVFQNGTPEQNDEIILKERLFEFTSEGKYWWDVLRFNKAFDLVPSLQGKEAQTYLLLFPIGSVIRSLEPLVEENPGWE